VSLAEGAARRLDEPAVQRSGWGLADLSETRRWAYFLLLPSLLLVAAVAIYPVASGVWLSFQRYNLLRTPVPVFYGFGQYADLFGDSVFWTAARNTLVWVTVGAGSQFLLGLVTALALNRPRLRGLGFLRVGLLLPWLMPTVVAGHMWSLLLDSRLGVVNDVLVRLGLVHTYVAWFAQSETAMWAVLMVDLWKNFPFFTLLLLAGLQGVPDELYEAAEVDGAGGLLRFKHITVPLMANLYLVCVLLDTIFALGDFNSTFFVSGGGPAMSTEVLATLGIRYAFTTALPRLGVATVMTALPVLIPLVFILMRKLRMKEGQL
jgi:multiple sugar transport system permease protein